jgi:polynucleotide 5'-hydroxyl-kinase GRC3/NOL9
MGTWLHKLDIPPAWQEAADRFLASPGLTLVLGDMDSGKSTLCHYLIYRAYEAGIPAAWIDADLGQSHLGPPTTLGMDLYPPQIPGDDRLFPQSLYFIGQTSPVGKTLEIVVGLRRLADRCGQQGLERVVINTSGFIQGPAASRLKWAKAELLSPRIIFALQRQQELESILIPMSRQYGNTIIRLPVSVRVLPKSWQWRQQYREERFSRYLQSSHRYLFPLADLSWKGLPLGSGEPLNLVWRRKLEKNLDASVLYGEVGSEKATLILDKPSFRRHHLDFGRLLRVKKIYWFNSRSLAMRLVGLLDRDLYALSLGLLLVSPWEKGQAAIWSPLAAEVVDQVQYCHVGLLRLDLSGRELKNT